MKKSFAVAGLGALMVTTMMSNARAEDERWPRWYLGLSGGYTYMKDEDVSGNTAVNRIDAHDGFGVGGSIGYLPSSSMPLLNALRLEAEITYHQNNVDKLRVSSGPAADANGTYNSTAYMANVFYDVPIANSGWSPYIGAGAGVATVHLSTSSGVGNTSGDDNEFAYQFLAGIGYTPQTIPNTQWTLGYRYLATTDPKFGAGTGDISTEYSSHSVEAGLKLRF